MAYKRGRKRTYAKKKNRARKSQKGGFGKELRGLLAGPTPQAQEVRMRFKSLYAQVDHADSGAEISLILKQGEELRVRAPKSAKDMANYQFLQLVKKGRSRANFLGLKPYASQLADLVLGLGAMFVGGSGRKAVASRAAPTSTALAVPDISRAIETVEESPGVFVPVA